MLEATKKFPLRQIQARHDPTIKADIIDKF